MGWYRWWSSRLYCPKYIIHCTCDKETSQDSLFDWWSFSHIFWGIIYSIPLFLWDEDGWTFLIVLGLAFLFELVENSSMGRKMAAELCCSKKFEGDNFWNSMMDIICCLLGFIIMKILKLFLK